MSEWKEIKWGEIATIEYGKRLEDYRSGNGNYPVFGTNGQIGKTNTFLSNKDGVIIGRKGAYRGVHYSKSPFFVIDTAFYLKPKIDFDLRWAYYQLLSVDINSLDSGSAIPSLSRESFYNIDCSLPPLPTQKKIAKVLGDLDDKIELNRRMNETLEEMAMAVYRHYFVNFGLPPGAKEEATECPFGNLVEHPEMGMIPEGWSVGKLGDVAEITSGKRPSAVSKQRNETFHIPLIGASGIMGYVREYLYNKRILITGRVGTIGLVNKIDGLSFPSDNSIVIIPNREKYYEYLHLFLLSQDFDSIVRGSTQPLITQTDVKNFQLIIPSDEIILRFFNIQSNLYKQIDANNFEIKSLTATRDYLLPRLLSGDVRVE